MQLTSFFCFNNQSRLRIYICLTFPQVKLLTFFTVVASYGVNFSPRLCRLQISDATLVPQLSTWLLVIFELRLAVHFTILILTTLDFNQYRTPFQKIIETHPDMLSFAWLHSLQIISGHLKYLFRTNCD